MITSMAFYMLRASHYCSSVYGTLLICKKYYSPYYSFTNPTFLFRVDMALGSLLYLISNHLNTELLKARISMTSIFNSITVMASKF